MRLLKKTIFILCFLTAIISGLNSSELNGFITLWQSRITENYFFYKPFEYSSCVIDSEYGRIFSANRTGEITILDSKSGEIISRYRMKDAIHRKPAISDNILIAGSTGGQLIALDVSRKHPTLIWQKELNGGIISDIKIDKDRLFVLTERNSIYVISIKDGTAIFQINSELNEGYSIYTSTPILIWKNRIIYTTSTGELYLLDSENGKLNHKLNIFNADEKPDGFSGISVLDDDVFISTFSGLLLKIDLTSGRIIWTRNLNSIAKMNIDNISKNILIAHSDGEISIHNRDGMLLMIRLWLKNMINGFENYKNRMLVRYADGTVLLLSIEDLSLISSIRFASQILSEITFENNQAYIFSSRGILYKFYLKTF